MDGSALKHTTESIIIMDLCSMLVHTDTDSGEGVCRERDPLNKMHCEAAKLLQMRSVTLLLCCLATQISFHVPTPLYLQSYVHMYVCTHIPLMVLAATDCVLLLYPSSTVIVPLKIVMCAFSDRTFFSFMC